MRHLALIVIAGLLSLPDRADALVMCGAKKPDGTLREGASLKLRAACRSNEIALDPVSLGLQGPQGPPGVQGQPGATGAQGSPGAQGARGPGAMMVDSLGAEIGVYLDAEEGHVLMGPVLVQEKWIPVLVIARPSGFAMTAQGGLFFESTNCAGPPMIVSEFGEHPALRSVPFGASNNTGPGALLYYETELAVSRTLRSVATPSNSASSCGAGRTFIPPFTCCETLPTSVSRQVSPTATLDISGFVPPFVASVQ